jgi:hypothetical protein
MQSEESKARKFALSYHDYRMSLCARASTLGGTQTISDFGFPILD